MSDERMMKIHGDSIRGSWFAFALKVEMLSELAGVNKPYDCWSVLYMAQFDDSFCRRLQ